MAAKKSAKKKVKAVKEKVKKVAKKTIKKKTAKKPVKTIKHAPAGKEFFLINGKKAKNYVELAKIMEHLEDQVFHHHVTADKNDFANWVKDVFQDINLAKQISGVKSKEHLELVLYRKVVREK